MIFSKYPTYKEYEVLYKKYIQKRNIDDFFQFIKLENTKEKNIIDICGGNGRFILEVAKKYNFKNFYYLDQEKDMIPYNDLMINNINIINNNVYDGFKNFNKNKIKFDYLICQQAVNYWFDEKTIDEIYTSMNDNGYFLFNTFNQKPSNENQEKEYELEGNHYKEISFLSGNNVHHIQIMNDERLHTTYFKWIEKEEYLNILNKYFYVEIHTLGKTDFYICKKSSEFNN